ncbi:three prime repair exonuclease 4 isoform X1 [Brienomyrus brachyistius]|uniref:three prime repair exonuclease 4 isoform X1 n=2 Tax=Brienomyrus brachyistius TaxID=42636 RepID=UPI0020B3ABB4|nr:three prime repair exonuclease 4 isoform X1 [Brienomyrus brachyistius]
MKPHFVFFDLETTGLGPRCDMVQLAAVSGGHSFNLYMVPRCRMQRGASAVTGLRVRRRCLYMHEVPVLANTHQEALMAFLAFLRMLDRPLLIGHNIRKFDCPVLYRTLEEFQLSSEFQRSISGFLDTLPLARDLLGDCGLQSYRQESLVKAVLGVRYAAHDALEDVRALQRLYWALQPTAEQALRHTFTLPITEPGAACRVKRHCRHPGQCPLWCYLRPMAQASSEAVGGD